MFEHDEDNLVHSLNQHLINKKEKESISLVEKYPFLLEESLSSYGATIFHYAVLYGNYTVVDYLIHEQIIDIHQIDEDGENAFSYAMYITTKDNGKMMKKLYNSGISIHHINQDGYSLIMSSAINDRLNSLEFFIENGADLNYESSDGNSLLFILEIGSSQINISFFMKHLDKFSEKNQKRLKKLRLKHLVERGISYE